ncbi:MAG: DUF2207 family protein [Acidimicrobiia bacterium]
MLSAGSLLAQTSSSDQGFSLPILVLAAALGLTWLATVAVLAYLRRAPEVEPGPYTQDLPAEPPALAGLLCADFELGTEAVPATLLDLGARRVVALEEIQPGRTICRIRHARSEGLTEYEQRVLGAVVDKAIDGVVPTEALTTGTEDASRRWQRDYAKEVVADAQGRGLTYDRWPGGLVALIGTGVLALGGLLYLASAVGGDTSGNRGITAGVAGGVAVAALLALGVISGRMSRSLAQLPTEAGYEEAARCLGLQTHLRENEHFDDVPPAAVTMWGRHLAYAAALGAARGCVAALPFGAEDDHLAWSRFGGRWRKVRVRYPRARPPAWGKHPGVALVLGLFWGAAALTALYGLLRVANAERDPFDPTFTQSQLDWIGRGALILCVPVVLLLTWALYVLIQAGPDLWRDRVVTGDVVRARVRQQVFQSDGDNPKHWYYLALDDGTADRISAWRVRRDLYDAHSQGETVTAVVTPNLGYLREIRAPR